MAPVANPFTAPRQAGQQMAEKAKEGKAKMEGESGSAIDDTGTTNKDEMPAQRPRTLSNEDVDRMSPEQTFRTTLNEHGEMVQDEDAPSMGSKGATKDKNDDLDLYDAMTAE